MSEPQHIHDLGQAYHELRRRSEWKKLAGVIKKYGDANSALRDLEQAYAAAGIARDLGSSDAASGTHEREQSADVADMIRANALCSIIFYMRATDTKSKERVGFVVQPWLDDDLRQKHERIKLLRNACLGHYGSGRQPGYDPWIRETVYLAIGPKSSQANYVFERANMIASDIVALIDLIDVIAAKGAEKVRSYGVELMNTLEAVMTPELMELLERHRFDPGSIISGEDPERKFAEIVGGEVTTTLYPREHLAYLKESD